MTSMTGAEAARIDSDYASIIAKNKIAYLWPAGLFVLVLVYLAYAYVVFDIGGLIAKSRLDRGVLLGIDSVAYKVHVEKNLRRDRVEIAVEGQRDARYDLENRTALPSWVAMDGDDPFEATIDLDMGDGYRFLIEDRTVTVTGPDMAEPLVISATADGVTWSGSTPVWVKLNPKKVEARPALFKRIQVTKGRILVFRYFWGWEDFWFEFRSPFNGLSAGELWDTAFNAPTIEKGRSNASVIFEAFWRNPGWQHGEVFIALLETIIMAFLGTVVAAFIGLPLAFVAAANFNPERISRFAVRRLFDFVRGIDTLIWSLIFIRAFGLGPLTGVMAIAVTDTGTLGKLFSEAIENIDNKQVEGMQSTGAAAAVRYRFGVIPQILPVFISQSLYYLESNTRSATVIGALGAGGIGLKLVETLRTGKDWENTLYIIILTLIVVIGMDILSGWLRRRLIKA